MPYDIQKISESTYLVDGHTVTLPDWSCRCATCRKSNGFDCEYVVACRQLCGESDATVPSDAAKQEAWIAIDPLWARKTCWRGVCVDSAETAPAGLALIRPRVRLPAHMHWLPAYLGNQNRQRIGRFARITDLRTIETESLSRKSAEAITAILADPIVAAYDQAAELLAVEARHGERIIHNYVRHRARGFVLDRLLRCGYFERHTDCEFVQSALTTTIVHALRFMAFDSDWDMAREGEDLMDAAVRIKEILDRRWPITDSDMGVRIA